MIKDQMKLIIFGKRVHLILSNANSFILFDCENNPNAKLIYVLIHF